MLVGFFPIAFIFLASYLLTLRWYERFASIPALLLGAVAQPLFTALLFSFGMAYYAKETYDLSSSGFERSFRSTASVSFVFTCVVAVPLALLATIPIQRRIKLRDRKEFYDPSDGFEIMIIIGVISSTCAALAMGSIWLFVSLATSK